MYSSLLAKVEWSKGDAFLVPPMTKVHEGDVLRFRGGWRELFVIWFYPSKYMFRYLSLSINLSPDLG